MTYLGCGRLVARALFLREFSGYYGMRSLLYSLLILPFHQNRTPWPVIAFQALLVAYVIWLVARSLLVRRLIASYLLLIALLSLLTSLSWFTSLIMPDVLGPVLYLCIYLLVFARDTLSGAERLTLALISAWAAAAHLTHLVLAAGLCVLFVLLLPFRQFETRSRLKAVAAIALILFLAAAAQIALNAYLTGAPSFNADAPPYLMARVIADGPGRWYLRQHCANAPAANSPLKPAAHVARAVAETTPPRFALCDFSQDLTDDADDFLWGEKGVWSTASDESKERMNNEEAAFVWATLRAYPLALLSASIFNSWQQLTNFGIFIFDANAWMVAEFDNALPGQRAVFSKSLQSRNALPLDFFSSLLNWTVLVSLALIAIFIPLTWRHFFPRLAALALIIISTVLANALVTGAFSTVEDRYQSRVIWLIPLLAFLLAFAWFDNRRQSRATPENA